MYNNSYLFHAMKLTFCHKPISKCETDLPHVSPPRPQNPLFFANTLVMPIFKLKRGELALLPHTEALGF